MCGISGIYNFSQQNINQKQIIERIVKLQNSRGPDAKGIWHSNNNKVTLGHNRLSIIDLSDKARQPFVSRDNNLIITASIYPSIIQIDISNTFNPLVIDITSMLYLYEQLSKFSQYIFYFSDVSLPPVSEWIVTQFHLHTDLSREYTGKKFEFKINDLTCGMIRFYSKHIGNGMNITRLEQIRTPRTSYVETMNQLLFSKDSSLEFYYV